MKISKIIDELSLEVVGGYNEEKKVEGVYIGDLLSLVMAKAKSNQIWITIQTHINIIAVGSLVDLSGVLIAEGMEIEEETLEKASEIGIPILRSTLSAYELACKLYELGI